jgi:hypothetical protein
LEGLGVEKAGIFYGHLEYITAIWYITYINGLLVIYEQFGIYSPVSVYALCQEKSGNPGV